MFRLVGTQLLACPVILARSAGIQLNNLLTFITKKHPPITRFIPKFVL